MMTRWPLLLLAACACPPMPSDFTFTPDNETVATEAARQWYECRAEVGIHIGPGGIPVRVVDSLAGGAWGRAYRDGCGQTVEIQYVRGIPPEYAVAVVAHEMGHAMGLNHTDAGLMMPTVSEVGVTPLDCAELRRRYP